MASYDNEEAKEAPADLRPTSRRLP
mgnify:CR=1